MTAQRLPVAQDPGVVADVFPDPFPTATAAIAGASIKSRPADFLVTERPLPALATGRSDRAQDLSQRLLQVRKTGINTSFVATLLARWTDVAPVEIGYAGRKDRNAVTVQWFSVPEFAVQRALAARGTFVDFAAPQLAPDETLQLLAEAWQPKKLRLGELQGNDFEILLRNVSPFEVRGWDDRLTAAVETLQRNGAPNYFGPQRFGHNNLSQALAWLAQQTDPNQRHPRSSRKRRQRRSGSDQGGWQRSILRSYLFNQLLAARVADGTFGSAMAGDVLDPDTGTPTGPLWGRGRSATAGAALALEERALAPHAALCAGLEHTGLTQQRRALCVRPENLSWECSDDELLVRFSLPSGAYASVVLAELFTLRGL